jgi:hypothetical protein
VTIHYPTWWRGFRWDSERLIKDVFQFDGNASAEGLTGVAVEPWLPAPEKREEWLKQGNGYLWVHRLGGQIERKKHRGVDEALIQMAALTSSRENSIELMEYVASILSAYDEGGLVQRANPHRSGSSTTFMRVPGEVVGPQLIPDRFRDERLIPAQWEIHADLPYVPDYREALGLESRD